MEEPFERGSKYTLYVVEYSTPVLPPKSHFLRSSFSRSLFSNKLEQDDMTSGDDASSSGLHHHQVR